MSPERATVTEVEGRTISLTNLDKVLFPNGFTKGDVIAYYVQVAPVLLPHLRGRPVTLVRFPDGVGGPSFFEKHVSRHAPAWVRTVTVPRSAKSGGELMEFVAIDDLATLVWVANLAALELHVPMWRSDHDGAIGPVDTMVFDLDPGQPATIVECCRVAQWIREALDPVGLAAWPKTSGGKGLQLYVPLDPPQPWERVHSTARSLARRIEQQHPDAAVSNMKRDLRRGKVLIDWSQNHAAKTTVAPYSLRAAEVPLVSTPVLWEEVEACGKPDEPRPLRFVAAEVLRRVAELGDLFGVLVGPNGPAS